MTDLSALLRDLRDLESPRQGTPGTPKSPQGKEEWEEVVGNVATSDPTPVDCTPPTEAPVCDDCGAHAVVLLVTDYGARYCRRRLRPEPLNAKPRTKGIA